MWNVVLSLGLVNWIATTIIVSSELTRPLREWITAMRYPSWYRAKPRTWNDGTEERQLTAAECRRFTAVDKLRYMLSCFLCAGTWIALAEVAVFGEPVGGGFTGFIASGLLVKAIGHLVLELRPQAWARP